MKKEILDHLNDPRQLEKLYRSNKSNFRQSFSILYPDIKGNAVADFWQERLNYESDEISWGTGKDLWFVILLALLAGFVAKIPDIFNIREDFFYPRNIGFIVLPFITAYFAWKNKLAAGKIVLIAAVTLGCLIFINSLPDVQKSDTLVLSCMHMVLVLWSVLGFAFVGSTARNDERRLNFLKYNGNVVVMSALIVIAAAILSGITIGLFSVIGLNIERFYFENVVIFGLPAVPILGTYLTQTNPQLVGKVSPVIAKIFSPLVLVMLVTYLVAMAYSGKNPYNDREFLMIFNALLIGVMAIIFFSVAGSNNTTKSRMEFWVLFLLSTVTIIVNGIALSAILFRISEWGLTPNRTAILGGNVLILINLLLVTFQLSKIVFKNAAVDDVGKVVVRYLPVYVIWVAVVTFLFPLVFGFR